MLQGLWYQVQDSGFRVQDFGPRIQVQESRVQGWWFEDWGLLGRIHEDLGLLDALSSPASAKGLKIRVQLQGLGTGSEAVA